MRRAEVSIVADCRAAVSEILAVSEPAEGEADHAAWLGEIGKWKTDFPLEVPQSVDGGLHTEHVIREIARLTERKVTVTTDVGQHQMWAAQHFGTISPRQFVTSGGLGTMGFGLPAAIGAQFGLGGDTPVWCISGDGSVQMCIQELMVARVYNLPIKLAIMNNQFLGMVRQWQEMFWQKHYSHVNLEQAPDFVKLAEAYGCVGLRCDKMEDVEATIRQAMAINDGPVVIDFRVAKDTNVYPMIPSGQTIHEMVVTRPAAPEDEPASACHFEPRPGEIEEAVAIPVRDTRFPDPAEVVDVAR